MRAMEIAEALIVYGAAERLNSVDSKACPSHKQARLA